MWVVLLTRINKNSLKWLILADMIGDVTGDDVMSSLVGCHINSLTTLNLGSNHNWWKSGEVFAQLLTFLKRQTHLIEFWFNGNDLTTSQTT